MISNRNKDPIRWHQTHIDQNDVIKTFLPAQDTTLNGSTVGNSFIWVDTLAWLLAEVFLQQLLNLGNTRGPANKNDLEYISL